MSGTVFPTPTINWGTSLQDPTTANQIATKEYVDAKVGGIPEAPTDGQTYGRDGQTATWNAITLTPPASTTAPLMNGTASAGVATVWSRGDHVHPTDTSRYAATNPSAYVNAAGAAAAAPVQSVATRTGAITLTHSDITDWATSLAPYALLASPAFTGTPSLPTGTTAVTQTFGTNNTSLATTAFVQGAVAVPASSAPLMDGTAAVGTSLLYARQDHVHPIDTSRAPLGSPALTGTPTAPTATLGTNTTQLATTAFVQAAIPSVAPATVAPLMDGLAAVGTSLLYARQDHIHPTDTSRAPLNSPGLTGAPTSVTPATADNSTAIATTAFVKAQGYGAPPSPATVAPLMNGSAAVGTSLLYARQDHVHPTDTSLAPLASPSFTGTPSLPTGTTAVTQTAGNNSTALATTAFVISATGAYLPLAGGVLTGEVTSNINLGTTAGTTALNINATTPGSGTNGPSGTQPGINVQNQKNNWLTTSTVGQIDGVNILCRQGGPTSDCSGINVNVGNTGTGFLAILEGTSFIYNNSTSTYTQGADVQICGLNAAANQYFGLTLTSQYGTLTSAMYVQNNSGTHWGNVLTNVRDGATTFNLDDQGNLAAAGTVNVWLATPVAAYTGSLTGYSVGLYGYGGVYFNCYIGSNGSTNYYYASGQGAAQIAHNNGSLFFNANSTSGTAGAAVTLPTVMTLAPTGALNVTGGGTFGGATTVNGTTTLNGATMSSSGGLNFGGQVATSQTDFSKHLQIYNSATGWGINYTTGSLNIVATAGGSTNICCGTSNILTVNTGGVIAPVLLKGTAFGTAISTQTAAAYTVGTNDHSLILNPTATMTLTLPAATGNNVGRMLWLKLISAFAVNSATANVVPLAGGAATAAIMTGTAGKYCVLQSNGTTWDIMNAN